MEIARTNCHVCGCTEFSSIPTYQHANLVRCNKCSYVFSNIVPSQNEIDQYYAETYELTNYFSPITRKRYHELLDKFEVFRKTNNLLDVGCGSGYFLEVAKERGWNVYGVEKTQMLCDRMIKKGYQISCGDFETCKLPTDEFDVIIAIEVIEHVLNPSDFISKANKLLRTGGQLYITTPNFNSYLRYYLKNQFDVIDYPTHLQYYTKSTLKKLLKNHNFKALKVETTGISLTRIRTSKNRSNQKFIGETSDDEMLRYRTENQPFYKFLKRLANSTLNLLKVGLSLKGSFVKL